MMTGLRWAARIAVLVLLVLVPAQAMAAQADSFADLSKVLQTGDIVEIAEWTRTRTKGAVVELTPGSITVVRHGRAVLIDARDVMEVRLWRRRAARSERLADAGSRCGAAPCMAMTLAFAGTTSFTRGVGRLFDRPKLVYRARW